MEKILFSGGSIELKGAYLEVSLPDDAFTVGPLRDEAELKCWLEDLLEDVPPDERVQVALQMQRLLARGHVFQPRLLSASRS